MEQVNSSIEVEPTEEAIKVEEDLLEKAGLKKYLRDYLLVRIGAHIAMRVADVERKTEHRVKNEIFAQQIQRTVGGIRE